MILRPCDSLLAAALQDGSVRLLKADLFKFVLVDGTTTFFWTSWNRDLTVGGNVYSSQKQYLTRSRWNVANTMEVPTLAVKMAALNDGFNGGQNVKTQIHNGVFDGASFLLSYQYMLVANDTSAFPELDIYGGVVAGVDLIGSSAKITVKGKINQLDQYVPRNVLQIGCNHAFCDVGCTLSRATYTAAYTVGASPTSTFIPWSAAPATPSNYIGGSFNLTGGSAAGQWRTIVEADATGLTLAYPLYSVPLAGDAFTAFEGCDKAFDSGSGRSCNDRLNTQHYRGFEFTPPPNAAY